MNPFASRCIRPDNNLYRFACDAEADGLLRRQASERLLTMLRVDRRAAIVGPHGTGKSTLIGWLEPLLRAEFRHVVRTLLTSEKRHAVSDLWGLVDDLAASPHPSVCLIVDGFEQLRSWDRLRLMHRAGRRKNVALLVTCHQSLWRMRPFWKTAWDADLSRSLTQEKVHGLPSDDRRELLSMYDHRLQQRDFRTLNLRDLWFDLYDDYEMMKLRRRNDRQESPSA